MVVKNQHGHKTRLSGSTDYIALYTADGNTLKETKTYRSQWRGSAADLYERVITRWSSAEDLFVIVEAKSPLTRLESHIPQVVAEALAL